MEDIWQTFGHNNIKKIFTRQLAAGFFPHAYLFSGPEGLGKHTLAKELAAKILKTENLASHPDFIFLETEGEIGIEDTKQFMSRLSGKPFLGEYKVAIIDNAQNLNTSSQNALLKTLEEPSPSTILILIQNNGGLLKTIVSRSLRFSFSIFSESQMREFAKAFGLEEKAENLTLSFGRPGRLMLLAKDKEFFKSEQKQIKDFIELKKNLLGQRLLKISELAKMETVDIKKMLLSWLNFQTAESRADFKAVLSAKAVAEALFGLDINQNKKLIFQDLFFKI